MLAALCVHRISFRQPQPAYWFFAEESASAAPFSFIWLAALMWRAQVENPQLHPLEQNQTDLFIRFIFNFRTHFFHIATEAFHSFTTGQCHKREKADK